MAINLATKYSDKIAEKFTRASFLQGNTSNDFQFEGVKSISIYTPITVDLKNYDREGMANRFGTPVEMQDEVQTLTLTQDKGFAITIDRGNNSDQMMVKNAGRMLNLQIAEKVVPLMDAYALGRFVAEAGCIEGLAEAPDKTNIVGHIFDGAKYLDDHLVPDDNRVLYLPSTYYNALRQSNEFMAVDSLAEKALSRGMVGMVADMKVIKVPDKYFAEGVYFLIAHKHAVIFPNKMKTARILTDVAGIDGAVLEGRNYFDAFVLGAKCDGVYAAVAADKVLAAPQVAVAGGKAQVTHADSGVKLIYTTDGTDPRYSPAAAVYVGEVELAEGEKILCYAKKDGAFASAVAEGKQE